MSDETREENAALAHVPACTGFWEALAGAACLQRYVSAVHTSGSPPECIASLILKKDRNYKACNYNVNDFINDLISL